VVDPLHGHRGSQILQQLLIIIPGATWRQCMKLRSIQEQHYAIVFLQLQNTYATILIHCVCYSLLMRAENCIATGGGHFEHLL